MFTSLFLALIRALNLRRKCYFRTRTPRPIAYSFIFTSVALNPTHPPFLSSMLRETAHPLSHVVVCHTCECGRPVSASFATHFCIAAIYFSSRERTRHPPCRRFVLDRKEGRADCKRWGFRARTRIAQPLRGCFLEGCDRRTQKRARRQREEEVGAGTAV